MKEKENKAYFTSSEVAKLVGVSRVTVFRKIKAGQIKAEKVGKTYLIPQEEIIKCFPTDKLTDAMRAVVNEAVDKAITEYGDALKQLGRE